jgi:hypothetical protein
LTDLLVFASFDHQSITFSSGGEVFTDRLLAVESITQALRYAARYLKNESSWIAAGQSCSKAREATSGRKGGDTRRDHGLLSLGLKPKLGLEAGLHLWYDRYVI